MRKHQLRCNYEEKEAVTYHDLDDKGLKKVCIAVFNRAYRDLYSRSERERESAIMWFEDDIENDANYITFNSVCNLIELNPDYVRKFMRAKNDEISKSLQGWSHLSRTKLFDRMYRSGDGNKAPKKTGVW